MPSGPRKGHVADAGVEGVAGERHAALGERRPRLPDVVDVQRDDVGVGREGPDAHPLGVHDVEGDRAGLELGEVAVGAVGRALEAERLPIEADAALEVAGGNGDEVDAGDHGGSGASSCPDFSERRRGL